MNEAYIFFTIIYSVVALAIFALFARDLVKWLKRRRTKHAPDVVESVASTNISPASEVSVSEADSSPATTQVM